MTVRKDVEAAFAAEGLAPHVWSDGPGFEYAEHTHPHHKVLYCVDGSITFRMPDANVTLGQGDRLDLPAGTRHAATVGPRGVTCMEAFRAG